MRGIREASAHNSDDLPSTLSPHQTIQRVRWGKCSWRLQSDGGRPLVEIQERFHKDSLPCVCFPTFNIVRENESKKVKKLNMDHKVVDFCAPTEHHLSGPAVISTHTESKVSPHTKDECVSHGDLSNLLICSVFLIDGMNALFNGVRELPPVPSAQMRGGRRSAVGEWLRPLIYSRSWDFVIIWKRRAVLSAIHLIQWHGYYEHQQHLHTGETIS